MEQVGLDQALDFVAEALVELRTGVALTGAGVSVPSGIPDFRSPGGLWERHDPAERASIGAFTADPVRAWELFAEQEAAIRGAEPNPAHEALARLERLGVLYGLITQNVDGLHDEAGSAAVVEFHGSFRRLRCPRCPRCYGPAARDGLGTPPRCEDCNHVLRPDAVLFGEVIPDDAMVGAMQLIRTCGVLLVVGTSASVPPAAAIPDLAYAGGALVVELNLAPTPLTDWCQVTILGDAAETLPKLADRVAERLLVSVPA